MNTAPHAIPRVAIQSIAGGLLLMALFTSMWTGIAQGGLVGHDHHLVLITFSIFCLVFILSGIKLFIAAKRFPKFTDDADVAERKKIMKWFGIIFGIEGTLIPVVAGALQLLGYGLFVLPTIALIVGLHFYPMAKIFNRKIDYYIATWTCVIAIISVFILASGKYPQVCVLTFLGIGVALATSIYGFYMLWAGYDMQKKITLFNEGSSL